MESASPCLHWLVINLIELHHGLTTVLQGFSLFQILSLLFFIFFFVRSSAL